MSLLHPSAPVTEAALSPELAAALGAALPTLMARQETAVALKGAADGSYLYLNEAMANWLALPAAQCLGHSDAELLDATLALALRTADQAALAQGSPVSSDHALEWAGKRRECHAWRMPLQAGDRRMLLIAWNDVSPLRQQQAQLRAALEQLEGEQRAIAALRQEVQDPKLRDGATGLNNRSHFEDQLRREVDLSTREHREFALVMIELDPLTPEVIAQGDAARARVLEALGRLLRGNTRAMDGSCRFDETCFAVLLSGVGLATAHSRMEGLRRQCATQIVAHGGRDLGFSVSMGVASFPHTAHSQDELLDASDAALAESRRRGGNRVTLASIRFEPV